MQDLARIPLRARQVSEAARWPSGMCTRRRPALPTSAFAPGRVNLSRVPVNRLSARAGTGS
ncbi:hypothetical protein [Streptomyces sp. NPDC056672]|uniref:hypothetical protein n=1 Tax=Streptomyces sp. NPDC056672 TaxID=3345906 RepID=UPI003698422F